jgi:hypothetical protein
LTRGRYRLLYEPLVHADIVPGDASRGEALFEGTPAQRSVECSQRFYRCDRLIDALNQGPLTPGSISSGMEPQETRQAVPPADARGNELRTRPNDATPRARTNGSRVSNRPGVFSFPTESVKSRLPNADGKATGRVQAAAASGIALGAGFARLLVLSPTPDFVSGAGVCGGGKSNGLQ